MPKITLTDLSVQKLKTPGTYWDAALPAFGVRVGKTAKTFILIRDGGRRIKLGRYPKISLQAARQKAISVEHNPNAAPRLTLEDGIKRYLDTHVRPNYRPRSAYNTERLLTLYTNSLAKKTMPDLKSADFTSIFDTLKPSEANHAFAALRTFFRWADRREYCANPLAKLEAPAKSKSRERVLTDKELKTVWQACQDDTYGKIVRLLILTGQRRGEIAALRRDWITADHITFPASITKNAQQHTIPLVGNAQRLVADAVRVIDQLDSGKVATDDAKCPPLLFPSSKTGRVLIGWQKLKGELDKRCGVAGWTLHDLRRTFSTLHAKIGTHPHVTEALLNHKSGTISPIAKIYNRYRWEKEMRDAMQLYEAYIVKLCSAA